MGAVDVRRVRRRCSQCGCGRCGV